MCSSSVTACFARYTVDIRERSARMSMLYLIERKSGTGWCSPAPNDTGVWRYRPARSGRLKGSWATASLVCRLVTARQVSRPQQDGIQKSPH